MSPSQQYASRVTIDIDSHVPATRVRVLRAVYGLRDAGAAEVDIAVSSSGEGYHIVGWFDEYLDPEAKRTLRKDLNDDGNRERMDEQRGPRGLPENTMWTEKDGNEGERQTFTTVEDALRHVARTSRTDHERARSLANHGRKAARDCEISRTHAVQG